MIAITHPHRRNLLEGTTRGDCTHLLLKPHGLTVVPPDQQLVSALC
jgi:hypothetical protein